MTKRHLLTGRPETKRRGPKKKEERYQQARLRWTHPGEMTSISTRAPGPQGTSAWSVVADDSEIRKKSEVRPFRELEEKRRRSRKERLRTHRGYLEGGGGGELAEAIAGAQKS